MIDRREVLKSLSDKTKNNLRELYLLDEKITDRVLDELIDVTIDKALSEVVGIVESWNEQVYDSFDFRKKLVNKLKRKLKRGEG